MTENSLTAVSLRSVLVYQDNRFHSRWGLESGDSPLLLCAIWCVCVCVYAGPTRVYGDQKSTSGIFLKCFKHFIHVFCVHVWCISEDNLQVWFSSSTMWIPGTILQLWGLAAGIFTCWVISPAFHFFFFLRQWFLLNQLGCWPNWAPGMLLSLPPPPFLGEGL